MRDWQWFVSKRVERFCGDSRMRNGWAHCISGSPVNHLVKVGRRRVHRYVCTGTCMRIQRVQVHVRHTAFRLHAYMYIRIHTRSCRIPLPPSPPCLNLNRLLLLCHRRPRAVAYHSSSTYQTLIQSEYKCCPLKQAGNGGKPSTTSTTELFLRPRFFSSSLVVRRVLNEYI